MKITFRIPMLLMLICLCSLLAAGPATKPTSQPAMQSMADNLIQYVPPAAPWVQKKVELADTVYFQTEKAESAIQANYAPKDFELDPTNDGAMAVAIVKDIKDKHAKKNDEVIQPAKIVKDKRFDIVIIEKFKITRDITEDQMRLYKSVGPRVMMVTVSCVSNDQTVIDAAHKAAEDLLASCKFNHKAFKK